MSKIHIVGRTDRMLFVKRSLWMSALLAGVVAVYAYFGSAGRRGHWPIHGMYYDLLAEGFRNGHLYIPISPVPELLAQKDPHNVAHASWWMGDLTLHDAHYYLYWGPLPAALQALGKAVAGVHQLVGDQYLTFSFFIVCAVFGALILERLARRLFPSVPVGLLAAAMLAFALANPVLFLITTGSVYQAAISGGQAFMLGGLLFAFDAVWNADSTRSVYRELILAGAFWGLSLTARVSLAPALALLALATALATAWPLRARRLLALRNAVVVGAPMLAAIGALLAYNEIRFGRWLEFGLTEQVTPVPYVFSIEYIPVGLYSYATWNADWSCVFPFVHSDWATGIRAMPNWPNAPADFRVSEPLVGWLRAVPLTWFAPVALLVGASSVRALIRNRADARIDTRSWRAYAWCVACFVVAGSVSGAPVLGQYFATMRYLADVTFGLISLGILGAFTLYARSTTEFARRVVATGFYALTAATVIMGLLLGYQGYDKQFSLFNPSLDGKLMRALSVCGP